MQDEVTMYRLTTASLKGWKVQIFGNNLNKSEYYLGRIYEQIEVRECLLSFSAESSVFQFVIQKFKN
jgi:hypothetical protein